MIEAEGGVERRIAVPGAFGVEQHGMAVAPRHQNVLRADVAMHQRELGRLGLGEAGEDRARKPRLARREGAQIGVEPQRFEQVIGNERGGDSRIVEGCGVDAAQRVADAHRRMRVGVAGEQLRLPERVVLGRQIIEQQDAVGLIFAQHRGREAGHDGTGAPQPVGLVMVALERGLPVALDLELG